MTHFRLTEKPETEHIGTLMFRASCAKALVLNARCIVWKDLHGSTAGYVLRDTNALSNRHGQECTWLSEAMYETLNSQALTVAARGLESVFARDEAGERFVGGALLEFGSRAIRVAIIASMPDQLVFEIEPYSPLESSKEVAGALPFYKSDGSKDETVAAWYVDYDDMVCYKRRRTGIVWLRRIVRRIMASV